jgi:hypothetical protein
MESRRPEGWRLFSVYGNETSRLFDRAVTGVL